MSPLEVIFDALNRAAVRYVVVGGVAVVLHGFARVTGDLDVVIDLAPSAARKAIETLEALGFRPRAPVNAADFADPAVRETWIREKGMMVFTMIDPADPLRQVDLFASDPIPFDLLYARAETMQTAHTTARVAAIEDLIELKRRSARPRDDEDIRALEEIRRRRST